MNVRIVRNSPQTVHGIRRKATRHYLPAMNGINSKSGAQLEKCPDQTNRLQCFPCSSPAQWEAHPYDLTFQACIDFATSRDIGRNYNNPLGWEAGPKIKQVAGNPTSYWWKIVTYHEHDPPSHRYLPPRHLQQSASVAHKSLQSETRLPAEGPSPPYCSALPRPQSVDGSQSPTPGRRLDRLDNQHRRQLLEESCDSMRRPQYHKPSLRVEEVQSLRRAKEIRTATRHCIARACPPQLSSQQNALVR